MHRRMLSKLGRGKSQESSAEKAGLDGDSPEASAARGVRLFCESGGPNNSGEEVLHLPTIVESAESSPAAATESAYLIRKFLSKDNYNRAYVQYNAIMLVRILADNPGPSFTKNIDSKFVSTVKELLRDGRDMSVQQILRETLDNFEHSKADDPTLEGLREMWKREKDKMAKRASTMPQGGVMARASNPGSFAQQQQQQQQNYFSRPHRSRNTLPPPAELAQRIEEARTSAKLLSQVVATTPSNEILSNELIKEFVERCQSASRSVQAYIHADNPPPDEDTLLTLIETNDQLATAVSRHQRALLEARKRMGSTPSPNPPPGATGPYEAPTEFAAPPPGPPPGRQQENTIFSAPVRPLPGRTQQAAVDGNQDPFGDHNEVPPAAGAALQPPLQPRNYEPQRHSYGLPPSSVVGQANGGEGVQASPERPDAVGNGAENENEPPAAKPSASRTSPLPSQPLYLTDLYPSFFISPSPRNATTLWLLGKPPPPRPLPPTRERPPSQRCLHATPPQAAQPLPLTATGPAPPAPVPAESQHGDRVQRRRQQAELLKKAEDLKNSTIKPSSAMKKRFWKDVVVKRDDDNNYTLHLDTRPVKNPTTKTPLLIPPTKPHLATALALEWDTLTSAQQALKSHLIPLTSIASRAHTLALEDAETAKRGQDVLGAAGSGIRHEIVNTLLRYLDTDTLLCWAPPTATEVPPELTPSGRNATLDQQRHPGESLRELQIRVATPILAHLTTRLWPGVELKPVLDEGSILPKSQPPATRAVVRGWMAGLPAWELVGLERAVLAGKSLCVGARLVGEWGENIGDGKRRVPLVGEGNGESGEGKRFGIEEAAEACSLEVRWQTGKWGEVEDSHDVEREDLGRQFGSVVLLVSGTGLEEA